MSAKTDNPATILVVEDDESISEAVAYNLKKHGYGCRAAKNGLEGLRMLRRDKPDLMILDLMLPEMDGWKLCEQAREEGHDLPIIILSARTSEFDKVQGLTMGADDYLSKPFGMQELMARVEAHLRRKRQAAAVPLKDEPVTAGSLKIDPVRKEAFGGGSPLGLTPKEFAILHMLARRAPETVSREDIYRQVWGYGMIHGDRSVDVFVRRIRRKLARALPSHSFLHTHYGFGYKFEVKKTPA
ncbi:MAG: response regulator transcription factor [Actinomycetota bacterium]